VIVDQEIALEDRNAEQVQLLQDLKTNYRSFDQGDQDVPESELDDELADLDKKQAEIEKLAEDTGDLVDDLIEKIENDAEVQESEKAASTASGQKEMGEVVLEEIREERVALLE
jgi:hypothetical protein